MTRRLAYTLIGLGVAILAMQMLCTGLILRGVDQARKEAEAAQLSAQGTLEMQKQVAGRPSIIAESLTIAPAEAAPHRIVRPDGSPVIFDPVQVERQQAR